MVQSVNIKQHSLPCHKQGTLEDRLVAGTLFLATQIWEAPCAEKIDPEAPMPTPIASMTVSWGGDATCFPSGMAITRKAHKNVPSLCRYGWGRTLGRTNPIILELSECNTTCLSQLAVRRWPHSHECAPE